MQSTEAVAVDVLDSGLSPLEARIVVLTRIRGGASSPVGHAEADELLELLRATPRRPGANRSLLSHGERVLCRWYETVGVFLPRRWNPGGGSRVVPDKVRFLGWLADVRELILAADGPACVGGSGSAVMASIEARYELDALRYRRAPDDEIRAAERLARNTRRRLAGKIGLAWMACLPKMQAL